MNEEGCDRCRGPVDDTQFYTVPLDANWNKTSGYYCSTNCAVMDNRFVNRPLRSVENWEIRERWMQIRYQTKEETHHLRRRMAK